MTKITEIFLRNFLLFTYYRKFNPLGTSRKSQPPLSTGHGDGVSEKVSEIFSPSTFQWTRDCRLAHKSENFSSSVYLGKMSPPGGCGFCSLHHQMETRSAFRKKSRKLFEEFFSSLTTEKFNPSAYKRKSRRNRTPSVGIFLPIFLRGFHWAFSGY